MNHVIIRLALALCLALTFVSVGSVFERGSFAQASQSDQAQPQYEEWRKVASRADEAIENARASTEAFEELREALVGWRQQFQRAQGTNANAIETVQRQIDDLGPLPEDGAEEEAATAAQRQELNTQLTRLREPVRVAELAFSRADGLIQGIDRIIRERQAEEILSFGPSPLNPTHWGEGLVQLQRTLTDIRGEFVSSWANPVQRDEAKGSLPAVFILSLMGLVLMLRGRRWSRVLTKRVQHGDPGAGRWILGFVVSSGSLFLPFIGAYCLIAAVEATNLTGLRISQVLEAIPVPLFFFLLARWLGTRVFPAEEARTLPLNLKPEQRMRGRWYAATLGLLAALSFFLRDFTSIYGWPENTVVVAQYPFLVLSCLLLWRLAALLRAHVKADLDADGEETYRSRTIKVLALILVGLAITVPVLGGIGYFKLAEALLYPSLATLQVLTVLLVLQRVVVEVYVLITGNRERAGESLIPVLIGFALVLLSLPFIALIWGARMADLSELLNKAAEGFDIGGTKISPAGFLTFVIVFVLGYTATRLVQGTLKNTILPKTRIDTGGRNAIVSGMGYLGIFLAALIAINSAGLDLSSLAIVAGALSVGIGFGLQNIVSNFVSGIILLIERPISEGDWIEVGGVHGTVRDISVRSTIIQTFDRSDVIVPNSDLVSGQVTNYTRGNTVGRVIVPVGVAYGTDTKLVEGILREVAEAHPLVLMNPRPAVLFRAFGASSLDFEIRAILRDVNYVVSVQSEMLHEINDRFVAAGIEIPFAQTDIWFRNPETLSGQPSAQTQEPPVHLGTDAAGTPERHAEPPQEDTSGDADGDGR